MGGGAGYGGPRAVSVRRFAWTLGGVLVCCYFIDDGWKEEGKKKTYREMKSRIMPFSGNIYTLPYSLSSKNSLSSSSLPATSTSTCPSFLIPLDSAGLIADLPFTRRNR